MLTIPVVGGAKICWKHVAKSMAGMFNRYLALLAFTGGVGRDNKACRKRWIHSLDPKLRKGTNDNVLLLDLELTFGSRSVEH